MDDADRELLYLAAFVFLLPWSLIYLVGRWLIRRTKDHVWDSSADRVAGS